MSAIAPSRSPASDDSHRGLFVGVLIMAAASVWFVGYRLHYLTDYSLDSYGSYFWPRRFGLLAHVSGGIVAVSAGLVQIWLGLSDRVGPLHRRLGKVYVTGVLIGVVAGFYLAVTIPGHLPYKIGLFMLCVAWLITTAMAWYSIRRRLYEQHREWMLRSFIVTFAFVTFRLASSWLRSLIAVPADPIADEIDTLMAWACWAIPLLVAEPLIQLRAIRRAAA
ncbi:MAG: DUF2306 domain-containing protein [Proteobacteria bacterium]|nr:DUF2306 domain-containing protein [Pseudomonadota bacterium]